MLCERTGRSLEALSRSHLKGVIVTLGAAGLRGLAARRDARTSPASRRPRCVDPTGCGDAFRAALLYGLERGWPLVALRRARQPARRAEDRPAAAARIMCWMSRSPQR